MKTPVRLASQRMASLTGKARHQHIESHESAKMMPQSEIVRPFAASPHTVNRFRSKNTRIPDCWCDSSSVCHGAGCSLITSADPEIHHLTCNPAHKGRGQTVAVARTWLLSRAPISLDAQDLRVNECFPAQRWECR